MTLANLQKFERKITSPAGEDGVIEAILEQIKTTNQRSVELGCGDGSCCLTANLAKQGWNGVFIDADSLSKEASIKIKNHWLTAENVNSILDKYDVPQDLDVLAIDLRGNDYWIWSAVNRKPRVVVVAYNPTVSPNEPSAVEYDPEFRWNGSNYFGASLAALKALANEKGYELVHCDQAGASAFFVLRDLLPATFSPPTINSLCSAPRLTPRYPVDPQQKMKNPRPCDAAQLGQSVISGSQNRVKKCRHGYMLYNPNDIFTGVPLDIYGEYCEGDIELFDLILNEGATVVDVGANIGAHTVYFAQKVGPQGRVYAFEPQRILEQLLAANVALNSLSNVHTFQCGLGARQAIAKLPEIDYSKVSNFGGVELQASGAGVSVEVRTLDSFEIPECLLLKVDVEGMELEVLQGAQKTIERLRPIIHVDNDKPAKSRALKQYLASLGYRMYWHQPPYFNPNNFFQNPKNVLDVHEGGKMVGQLVAANLLCVDASLNIRLDQLREALPGDGWHPFGPELAPLKFTL